MVILLNGAFGVGKTTVATLLRRRIAGSAIFDPETVGYGLQRLAHWLPLRGRDSDDYQDMPMWRASTLAGIRAVRFTRPTVIVPMAFSNLRYLAEIRDGARRFDANVRHFCLVAPPEVIHARLSRRGVDPSTADGAWTLRRASECCAVHGRPEFAEHVDADRTAAAIVNRLSPP